MGEVISYTKEKIDQLLSELPGGDNTIVSIALVDGDLVVTKGDDSTVTLDLPDPTVVDVQDLGVSGSAKAITTAGQFVTVTLTDDCVFSFPTPPAGAYTFVLQARQDSDGGRVPTFPSSVLWPDDVIPTFSSDPDKVDQLRFSTYDLGVTWFGSVVGIGYNVEAAFTPASISGLKLWVSAEDAYSDVDGVTPAVNLGNVARLTDRSGLNNHPVQADVIQPQFITNAINGLPVISFDGDIRQLDAPQGPFAQPNTVFVVAKVTDSTMYRPILSTGPGAGSSLYLDHFTGRIAPYGGNLIFGGPDQTGAYHVFEGIYDSSASKGIVDGGVEVAADAGALPWITIRIGTDGSGSFRMLGDIAEIVFYNALLSDDDRAAVRQYLADKYALTVI